MALVQGTPFITLKWLEKYNFNKQKKLIILKDERI